MPKIRLEDLYHNPESFDDFTGDNSHDHSASRTQPFFRNKKYRKKDRRLRSRNSRQEDDKDLY